MVAAALRNAEHLGLDVDGRVADAEQIPYDDATFDVVVGHAVLHHIPDLDTAFAEILRVLKPGGRFVFAGEPTRHGDYVARRLSRFPRLWSWLMRVGGKFQKQLEGRNAYRSAVIASFTPVAFSVQCHVSGLYRLPLRAFAVILALRIPKLVLFYYLVKLGWAVF